MADNTTSSNNTTMPTPQPPTSASELLARYASGERDFQGADLTGAILREATLRGAILREATLSWADLTGADLRKADLRKADLRHADLGEADLGEANLRGANLTEANLYRADLTGADLTGATLRGADLSGATLYRATLRGVTLRGADLSGATLYRATLRGVKHPPHTSHDFVAEVLRQAAGDDVERRMVAGVLLMSRDWCWADFGRMAQAHTTAATRAWIVDALKPWPELVTLLRRHGIAESIAAQFEGRWFRMADVGYDGRYGRYEIVAGPFDTAQRALSDEEA